MSIGMPRGARQSGSPVYLPPVGLAVLPLFLELEPFLETCFRVFLVVVDCVLLPVVLAGVWAAKVNGTVASAKARVAKIVFFMVCFSPSRALPAYNPMMRCPAFQIDSLRRL